MTAWIHHFACLDELIQVIYQSVDKLVVISRVVDDAWTVHLGLSGLDGRWWRGTWTEDDVVQQTGTKPSDKLLQAFATDLAKSFVQGEMYLVDWSRKPGTEVKLSLGPSRKPAVLSLTELSPAEGAAYATSVFLEIALQAQSRRCQLNPDLVDLLHVPSTFESSTLTRSEPAKQDSGPSRDDGTKEIKKGTTHVPKPAKSFPSEDEAGSATAPKSDIGLKRKAETKPSKAPTKAPPRLKGASLANPSKKARRIEAIEFGSDDDD